MSLEPSDYLKGLPLDYVTNSQVASYFEKDFKEIKMKPGTGTGTGPGSDEVLKCIEVYNKNIGAGSKVMENIEKLKEVPPIVTGQQPCLLTGPLYVIYKALTAVILAERYRTAPVFWNASEDDDISEVDHIFMVNADLREISVPLTPGPFCTIELSAEDVQYIIERIKALTPPTEFRDDILAMITCCSLRFSKMFSQLLSTLTADYGLIMVEPHIFAELTIPVYEKLIEHPLKAAALVNETGDALEAAGYKRQLHKPEDSCSFYLIKEGRRLNVTYHDQFQINEHTFAEKELLELLHDDPASFSSNVISRPLIQDFLFSTLGYCAGPGEISYFAQMSRVYKFFGVEEPYIIPRFGATLIEPKVQKVLSKYPLELLDLQTPEKVIKALAKKDAAHIFHKTRKVIVTQFQELQSYIGSIDSNLKRSGAAARTGILNELQALEEKTATALKKEKTITKTQIEKASTNIFPQQTLQERALNIFQYLIRYPSIVETLHKHFEDAPLGAHLLIYPGD